MGPQATLLMPLNGPTGCVLAFHFLTESEKAICKRRPGLLSLSEQSLSVAITLSNKIDFSFCAYMEVFLKFSYICTYGEIWHFLQVTKSKKTIAYAFKMFC